MPKEKIHFKDRVYFSGGAFPSWRAKTAEERLKEQSKPIGEIKPEVANLYIALTEKDL